MTTAFLQTTERLVAEGGFIPGNWFDIISQITKYNLTSSHSVHNSSDIASINWSYDKHFLFITTESDKRISIPMSILASPDPIMTAYKIHQSYHEALLERKVEETRKELNELMDKLENYKKQTK